jgi:hypothetical protein
MNTPIESTRSTVKSNRSGLAAGLTLIAMGALLLLAQVANFPGLFFLPALAGLFLIWGLATRTTGLLIPGGILAGIGSGAYLVEQPFAAVSDPAKGGLFLLAFAAGWAMISALSIFTSANRRPVLWPLIPAGVLALVGALLTAGGVGLKVLEAAGQGWPVILIALGLYFILRRKDN